jgi:prepilin-type N-terminal cleavage/methylation domain-containing protein
MIYANKLSPLHIRKLRKLSGFTLIEMMIVLVIIGTLTLTGVAAYSRYNADQRLKQTALSLKNNLRLAQTDASSALNPPGCAEFNGYIANLSISGYSIQPVCDGTPTNPIKSLSFTPDITFLNLPQTTIMFGVLTNGITNVNNSIDLVLVGQNNRKYSLTVYASGNITDNGFE